MIIGNAYSRFYDIRPSYLTLAKVVGAVRPAPVLALTATATPATRQEIVQRLGRSHPRKGGWKFNGFRRLEEF